jgi:uncharacterized protein YdeI (BOF family)
MKRILALMISGLMVSTAALAQDSKMNTPGSTTATSPSGSGTGAEPAKKMTHKKKKHKSTMAKADGEMKKSDTKPTTDMSKPAPQTTPK